MYTKEISALTKFLAQSSRSLDEVCKYLIVVSLQNLAPRAIYVGEVTSDGHIEMRSSFGFDSEYIGQWQRIPVSVDIPLTESIAKDECVLVPSKKEFFRKYPDLKNLGTVDDNWNCCIAVPMQSQGAYFLVLHGTPTMDQDFEHYLRSIASLIVLHLRTEISRPRRSVAKEVAREKLSDRQVLICDLVRRGYTNPEIAKEIGYSESLVRQETIAIYSFYGISGRKDLIRNPVLKQSELA